MDAVYDDIAIEHICETEFNTKLTITRAIVRGVSVGMASHATLFDTSSSGHFLLVASANMMTLGDVIQIARRMNLIAEKFIPPRGDDEYFQRVGTAKFKQLFPGKYITSRDDTRYYESLARYNPALVGISRVNGEIKGYVVSTKQWRKVCDYVYKK
ncbi:MAG: hypothetical protein PVI21_06015 [Candidatus Woesebacteria bacterium]|jgi:hypothetical protein